MNKSCEYCQYNGPYGSIINPCENCPNNDFMINDKVPITQPIRETTNNIDNMTYTITTNTNGETFVTASSVNNTGDIFVTGLSVDLPTADECRKAIGITYSYQREWSEPKYICPKCGGGMCRNEMVVLTSYPAQYEYKCDKCGHVEYQFG